MGRRSRLKRLQKKAETTQIIKFAQSNKYIRILNYTVFILTSIAIFSLGLTVLRPGIPSGHDVAAHYSMAKLINEALKQGQFPVRWVEWTYNGASVPLFNFYQSGLYYLISFLHLFIPSLISSIKVFVVLIWWVGALFMFLLMRRFGNLVGCLSCLIYAFSPYIIADIFVRAAYPELMAISFSIGVLWAIDRLIQTSRWYYIPIAAICFMLVITSHILTLIIMSFVLSLFTLITFFNNLNFKGLCQTALALVLGVGLSGYYLFPAIVEYNLIQNEWLTQNSYDFHHHFVEPIQFFSSPWGYGISVDGIKDGMSFQFGIIQWIIISLSLILVIATKFTRLELKNLSLIYLLLGLILYASFFMTSVSIFFWENFQIISVIQYPWRYLMIVAISCAILSGLLLNLLKNPATQSWVVIASIPLVVIFYGSFLKPSQILPQNFFDIDSPNWKLSEGVIKYTFLEKGYLPKKVSELPERGSITRWQINSGSAKVKEGVLNYDYLSFTSESTNSFVLGINSHDFAGWKAFIDQVPTQINSDNPYGFINITVPAGLHKIEVKFTNTLIRSFANIITLATAIGLLAWSCWKVYKKS